MIIGGGFLEAEERKTAMSHDEMQDYWKTLCSFTGEDIPNEINQLMAKIRYPRFLYKYRAVNNNNLDALRSNKLFFSKASSYDDPFDTFLHIDVEKIRQEFDSNYWPCSRNCSKKPTTRKPTMRLPMKSSGSGN